MSLHGTVGTVASPHKLEDFLHLNDIAFQTGDFGNGGDLAPAVRLALKLHNELDRIGDLAAD
jgi:hypothetical protein